MDLLNKQTLEFGCPICDFFNEVFIEEIIWENAIICRGCKGNIKHIDEMGKVLSSIKRIQRKLAHFHDTFKNIDIIL